MAAGDIDSEIGCRVITLTEDGTSAIAKGDLCVIRAGKVHACANASDTGPYVVAVEAVAISTAGRFIIEGVVELAEDAVAALTLGDLVKPGTTSKVKIQKTATVDFSSNYVASQHKEKELIVGMAYEAIGSGGTGRILLGIRAGLSD